MVTLGLALALALASGGAVPVAYDGVVGPTGDRDVDQFVRYGRKRGRYGQSGTVMERVDVEHAVDVCSKAAQDSTGRA
jgi:hypothetical protein